MDRPSIVLVVVDCARADHLSCYGYRSLRTPHIDALAEQSVRFAHAIAPAVWSVPSHASLFSGLYLSEHQLNDAEHQLHPDIILLAEALSAVGYHTAAISNNPYIGRFTELARGFDTVVADNQLSTVSERRRLVDRAVNLASRKTFVGDFVEPKGHIRRGQRTIDRALGWLAEQESTERRPFFLFLNLMEVHVPYAPPYHLISSALPRDRPPGRLIRDYGDYQADRHNAGCQPITDEKRRIWNGLYDASLAYADQLVGRLWKSLEGFARLEHDLMFILTSDHGDNLGDHGVVGHALSVHDTLVHIPLIMWHPDLPRGTSIDHQVQLHDLFPTLIQVAGAESQVNPLQLRRPSLLDNGSCDRSKDPYAFSEFLEGPEGGLTQRLLALNPRMDLRPISSLTCVRTTHYKYVESGGGDNALFDLRADPGEENNMIGMSDAATTVGEAKHALEEWRRSLRRFQPRKADLLGQEINEDLQQRLRALGYL